MGALDGLKVLDMGRVQAAPFSAAILADMGADVIKLEMPGVGDESRSYNPPGVYFSAFNRSKRGITLDLKKGKDVFFRLIKNVDVLIENFRPGVMQKLGFGYDVLKEMNPQLIYAAISGYGQNGPYKSRACYDPIAQAMSGLMSITGFADSEPVRCGAAVCDIMAGLNATIGILAALQFRNRTGHGQMIDISLCDSSIVSMTSVIELYLSQGIIPGRNGNGYAAWAPGGCYQAKDGYFSMSANGEKGWRFLCETMGKPELYNHPDYSNVMDRIKNRAELDRIINKWTEDKTVDYLVGLFLDAGLPAAPVMNIAQVVNDEHFSKARNMFAEIDDPAGGKVTLINSAIKMSETPPFICSPAPALGADNREVYKELGYSDEEIEDFIVQGII